MLIEFEAIVQLQEPESNTQVQYTVICPVPNGCFV